MLSKVRLQKPCYEFSSLKIVSVQKVQVMQVGKIQSAHTAIAEVRRQKKVCKCLEKVVDLLWHWEKLSVLINRYWTFCVKSAGREKHVRLEIAPGPFCRSVHGKENFKYAPQQNFQSYSGLANVRFRIWRAFAFFWEKTIFRFSMCPCSSRYHRTFSRVTRRDEDRCACWKRK